MSTKIKLEDDSETDREWEFSHIENYSEQGVMKERAILKRIYPKSEIQEWAERAPLVNDPVINRMEGFVKAIEMLERRPFLDEQERRIVTELLDGLKEDAGMK